MISSLKDDRFFQGLVGSVTGYAVAKFLKLSKRSQILLTLGGFGIARALIKHQEQQAHGDKTHTYDKKTHTYEVKY